MWGLCACGVETKAAQTHLDTAHLDRAEEKVGGIIASAIEACFPRKNIGHCGGTMAERNWVKRGTFS